MKSVITRMARVALETKVLGALAETQSGQTGLTFSDIRDRFSDKALTDVLDRLVAKNFVTRFDGCIFAITSAGRARLLGHSAPACVEASS